MISSVAYFVSAAMERGYDPLRIWFGSWAPGLSRTALAETLRLHGVVCGDMTIFHGNGGVDTAAVIELRSEHEAMHALGVLEGLIDPRIGNPWRPLKAKFAYERAPARAASNVMELHPKTAGRPIITLPNAVPTKAVPTKAVPSKAAPLLLRTMAMAPRSAASEDPRPSRKRAADGDKHSFE